MKPLLHAKSSAKHYGGAWQDYIDIHTFIDSSKAHVPDSRHRMILHNSFGIFLTEKVFGVAITNSSGKDISVRDIAERHVLEDLGTIPTLEKCLSTMTYSSWMSSIHTDKIKKFIPFKNED